MDKKQIIQEIRNSIKELNGIASNPASAILHLESALSQLRQVMADGSFVPSEIEIGKQYQFHRLESWLNEWENRNKALIVTHKIPGITPAGTGFDGTAIMHTFGGNFCGDWLSGDGVLFYNDNEAHSAEPDQEFTVVQIITF